MSAAFLLTEKHRYANTESHTALNDFSMSNRPGTPVGDEPDADQQELVEVRVEDGIDG